MKPFTKFCIIGAIVALIGIATLNFGATSSMGIISLLAFGLGFIAVIAGIAIVGLAAFKFKEDNPRPQKLKGRE